MEELKEEVREREANKQIGKPPEENKEVEANKQNNSLLPVHFALCK